MYERLKMHCLAGGDDYLAAHYGAAQVNTLARDGFSQRCPYLTRLFGNMTVTIDAESQWMSAVWFRIG